MGTYKLQRIRKMKRFTQRVFVLFVCGLIYSLAIAENLQEVFKDALQFDPTYRRAEANWLSTKEVLPQSIAAILPNLGLNNISNTAYHLRVTDPRTPAPQLRNINWHYGGQNFAVTLTQPIVNMTALTNIFRAQLVVKQATAMYGASLQDLILRTAKAYLAVIQARDILFITQEQKKSLAAQVIFAKKRLKTGVGTVIDVYNAQANYEGMASQEIADQTNLRNNETALRAISGRYYEHLDAIPLDKLKRKPVPASSTEWIQAALRQNLTLQASRYAMDAARAAIKSKAAVHFPTVSGVANYTQTDQGTIGHRHNGRLFENTNVGVMLSVPIYQGGLVLSQTRQAKYDFERAIADMKINYEQVQSTTKQSFDSLVNYLKKLKVDQKNIKATNKAFHANELAYKAGTGTSLEILVAQRAIYLAQRQYILDSYAYLTTTFILKQQVAILSEKDLISIASIENNKGTAYRNS